MLGVLENDPGFAASAWWPELANVNPWDLDYIHIDAPCTAAARC
jgi:hypothetical protein